MKNKNTTKEPAQKTVKPKIKLSDETTKKKVTNYIFAGVMIIYAVVCFTCIFLRSQYYSTAFIIIQAIVTFTALPFTLDQYDDMKPRTPSIITAVVSIPFIANWVVLFVDDKLSMDRDPMFVVFFIVLLLAYVLSDIILILNACGVIKKRKIFAWIELVIAFIAMAFTIFFFIYMHLIIVFAAILIAVQVFIFPFMAYHVLMKQNDD